jgi:hypothetical protein
MIDKIGYFSAALARAALLLAVLVGCASEARAAEGELTLSVVDRDSGRLIPCRMHLKNAAGVARKVPGLPFWRDHFVFPGKVTLKLSPGNYTFLIERGPEYARRTGYFRIQDHAQDEKVVDLARAVDMAADNWWSGELHIHRSLKDIELLMQAEDLHVAPVITWWNKKSQWTGGRFPPQTVTQFDGNRFYDLMGGEDERGGGALMYFNMDRPLEITAAEREHPSAMEFLLQARRRPEAWVDVEKPFWWDVPVWLASGLVDSVGLANNHMHRQGMLKTEAWGKPRDKNRYRDPWGNGQWSQDLYYRILECGLRIPPSAGSASGVMPNPIGYNRVYVWVDKSRFNYQTWWEGFKMGRVTVTNGPLIRPYANGRLPGSVFKAAAGEKLGIDIAMNLTTRDPISYLEVIKNGQVVQSVRLADWSRTGHFPPLVFERSGWFLVRAITDVEETYRFASSGPWYVEIGDEPRRVSRESAQFFLDWVGERAAQIKLDNPDQRRGVLKHFEMAQGFWQDLVSKANAP